MLLFLVIVIIWMLFFFAGLQLGKKRSIVNQLILESRLQSYEDSNEGQDMLSSSSSR